MTPGDLSPFSAAPGTSSLFSSFSLPGCFHVWNFGIKYSLCSFVRYLQDFSTFSPLQTQGVHKFRQSFPVNVDWNPSELARFDQNFNFGRCGQMFAKCWLKVWQSSANLIKLTVTLVKCWPNVGQILLRTPFPQPSSPRIEESVVSSCMVRSLRAESPGEEWPRAKSSCQEKKQSQSARRVGVCVAASSAQPTLFIWKKYNTWLEGVTRQGGGVIF